MRAAIYTRVSSEEQLEGYSLQAQQDAAKQLCAMRDWTPVYVYEERGRSGKSALRPEFQTMICDAEAGLFDVVVVHKLDRFSRSLIDTLTYLNRLNQANVSLVSVTEQFDFSTPFGKLVLAVIGAFAEWYLDNLRAETRKGKKARAKAGDWNGTLSYGYTTPRRMRKELTELGDEFKTGKLEEAEYSRLAELLEEALERYPHKHDTAAVPCPVNAEAVVLAYTWYATGQYSDVDIAWKLNEAGYRTTGHWGRNPFGKDTVTWLLQNRFYLGETSYQGKTKDAEREWLPGNHEPLISQELFDRCQQVRRNRRHDRSTSANRKDVESYPLTSLLVCTECGVNWRGQNLRGQRRYRDMARQVGKTCNQSPKSVKADVLEKQVEVVLWTLQAKIPADWRKRVLEKLSKNDQQGISQQVRQRQRQQLLSTRLDRARQLFLMGDLEKADYIKLRDDIEAKMTPVVAQNTMLDMDRAADLLEDLRQLWEVTSAEERKALYRALFKTIYVHEGRIAAVQPAGALWKMLNLCIIENDPVQEAIFLDVTLDGSDGRRILLVLQVCLVWDCDLLAGTFSLCMLFSTTDSHIHHIGLCY